MGTDPAGEQGSPSASFYCTQEIFSWSMFIPDFSTFLSLKKIVVLKGRPNGQWGDLTCAVRAWEICGFTEYESGQKIIYLFLYLP